MTRLSIQGLIYSAIITLFLLSCDNQEKSSGDLPLFSLLSSEQTGIDFVNVLDYDENFNIYTYRNYYNGGGVGLGDFNNDNLLDIYMISNTDSNRLYINKGDLSFEEITISAGVYGVHSWSTGVSIADVNADGLLDIYVCNSGEVEADNKQNELFINNGDLTFTEQAEKFGLADRGYTTHASFFDYDRDGDLDVYMLNNSFKAIGSFDLSADVRNTRHSVGGDRLYRNDSGFFKDVSEEAGIYGSIIGFGLGVTVGDMNNDGWQDLYISNDFFERDYIYMNNQDGTFEEVLEEQMRSISGASMGADMADIDNDGYMDIFVTEMMPRDEGRIKMVTTFESWERYQENVENGYYHQFTRNMLHHNNGNSTYSEIGRMAEVYATDWSWGALMADFDNDGWKDIFVSNGIYQDLTNQDYLMYISDKETQKSIISRDGVDYEMLIDAIPSEKISNYAFSNNGDLTFSDKTQSWGLAEPSHSNGSAYGDLDNDGDLDLVISNVNMPMFIYRNNLDKQEQPANYLKLNFEGNVGNPFAVGTRVQAKAGNLFITNELVPVRGFESTMDHRMLLGLGSADFIDELKITWPDGRVTHLDSLAVNQVITISQLDSEPEELDANLPYSKPLFSMVETSLDYIHKENKFVDFHRDKLLFHMRSTEGPKVSVGDVNGDNLDDLYIGGAKGQAGQLFVGTSTGMKLQEVAAFSADQGSEDLGSEFFDADGDGDLDLYVCSGGNEYPETSQNLQDKLYFNDGHGNFIRQAGILPAGRYESTSTVTSADYDKDGDLDLFVGVRLKPFLYGVPGNGYILNNDGTGKFTNVTMTIAPELANFGMITDATWIDFDLDEDLDLVIVGEWLPISVFVNNDGQFANATVEIGLEKTKGWWNTLAVKDIDGNGYPDLVAGNHGLNSRFKASYEQPVRLYVNDFSGNGNAQQIITQYNGDTAYPIALRHDVLNQIPGLNSKYKTYEDYKGQTIDDMFEPNLLSRSVVQEVTMLTSVVVLNKGTEGVDILPLPQEVQLSPVYAIGIDDFNHDGYEDVLLGGNLHGAKPEVGRYDASYGNLLLGSGDGTLIAQKPAESGILWDGEVRDIKRISINGTDYWIIARNNTQPILIKN